MSYKLTGRNQLQCCPFSLVVPTSIPQEGQLPDNVARLWQGERYIVCADILVLRLYQE